MEPSRTMTPICAIALAYNCKSQGPASRGRTPKISSSSAKKKVQENVAKHLSEVLEDTMDNLAQQSAAVVSKDSRIKTLEANLAARSTQIKKKDEVLKEQRGALATRDKDVRRLRGMLSSMVVDMEGEPGAKKMRC